MSDLAQREFVPARRGDVRLQGQELEALFQQLGSDWKMLQGRRLQKQYKFDDFRTALDFTNKVGQLAEALNHHPEICLGWGFASIAIWTHSIDGLHEGDFIFAARCDRLAR
jgi:4a-hydroxytetrahydrobiopterin dehydratase